MKILVIEEVAGQHQDMVPTPEKLRYCECGGNAFSGSASCYRCGRYIRGLFRVGVIEDSYFARLLSLRPYEGSI